MNILICTAAGLSSRMGAFKPLLPLGDQTIIRTLIASYRVGGVDRAIVVTGRDAHLLEEHVRDLDVVCRRNEHYATNDMFESVRIGLRAVLDEGAGESPDDRILITPCDIPLVRPATIRLLLESREDACVPVMDGRRGHPLCLRRALLQDIAAYAGDEGLRGALRSAGVNVAAIPVEDPGVLMDADTPEDYAELLRLNAAT